MKLTSYLMIVLQFILGLSLAQANDWTSFRGKNGSGFTSEKDIPVQWDFTTGENVAWSIALPLPGASTPVVTGEKILLHAASEKERRVYCYDATNGKFLWNSDYTDTGANNELEVYDSKVYASPSGVTDGKHYVAAFANGDVVCFSIDGKELWAKNMADTTMNMYGQSCSLAYHGGTVFAQISTGNELLIFALDVATGEEKWKKTFSTYTWASPIIAESEGKTALVTATSPDFMALDVSDGKILWRADLLDGDVAPSPLVADGKAIAMFSSSGVYAIEMSKRGEIGIDDTAWNHEYLDQASLPETVSPASDGELIYIWSQSVLAVLEAATGKIVYEKIIESPGTFGSPTIAGDKVILPGLEKFLVVQAGREYKLLGESKVNEMIDASPVVSDGRLFLRGAKYLHCIQQGAKGKAVKTQEKKEDDGLVRLEEVLEKGSAFDVQGEIHQANVLPRSKVGDWLQFRGDGRQNASFETGWVTDWPDDGPPLAWIAEPGAGNGTIVVREGKGFIHGYIQGRVEVKNLDDVPVGDRRNSKAGEIKGKKAKDSEILSAIDTETGEILWQYIMQPNYVESYNSPHNTPAIDENRVYAHGVLGNMVCIDAESGKEIWRTDMVEQFGVNVKKYSTSSSPLVYRDQVYIIEMVGQGVGVFALDKMTGELVWKQVFPDYKGQNCHSSAVNGFVDGKDTILCHLGMGMVGFDPTTGDIFWNMDYSKTWPVLDTGRVYSSESFPIVRPNGLIIDRIWNDVSGDAPIRSAGNLGRTFAIRVKDAKPELAWINHYVAEYYLGNQIWGDALICFNNKRNTNENQKYGWDSNRLTCLDLKTGKVAWETQDWPMEGVKENVRRWRRNKAPTILMADGKFIINDGLQLILAEATTEGYRQIDGFRVDLTAWSNPVLAHGKLYVRNGKSLLAFDLRPGAERKLPLPEPRNASPK